MLVGAVSCHKRVTNPCFRGSVGNTEPLPSVLTNSRGFSPRGGHPDAAGPASHTNTIRTLTEGSLRCLPEAALHDTETTTTGGPSADTGSPLRHWEFILADIVIRNITGLNALVEAPAHLFVRAGEGATDMFSDGTLTIGLEPWIPSDFELEVMVGMDDEFDCIYDIHSAHCTCVSDARTTDPRQLTLLEVTPDFGLVQYVPCPRQGTHSKLTECWMCWCDVDRGAISARAALAAALSG